MARLTNMIVLAATFLCGPAAAFWGWSDSDQYSEGRAGGDADVRGDAAAEGEMEFNFSFTGRMKADADVRGDADSDSGWSGYSYESPYWNGAPLYYGPYGMPYTAPVPPVPPAE